MNASGQMWTKVDKCGQNERGEIMTEQEAIKVLNDAIAAVKKATEAFKVAILALEKQIPKRTVKADEYEYDEVCPECGHKPCYDAKYCEICGQALKIWEDEE